MSEREADGSLREFAERLEAEPLAVEPERRPAVIGGRRNRA
jgi:hypothetical protein